MVAVENGLRVFEVKVIDRGFVPRKGENRIDVGARHGVLGRAWVHTLHSVVIAFDFFVGFFGQVGGLDLLPELIQFLRSVIVLAQLFLDRLELFAEVVIPLRFAELVVHFRLHLRGKF